MDGHSFSEIPEIKFSRFNLNSGQIGSYGMFPFGSYMSENSFLRNSSHGHYEISSRTTSYQFKSGHMNPLTYSDFATSTHCTISNPSCVVVSNSYCVIDRDGEFISTPYKKL